MVVEGIAVGTLIVAIPIRQGLDQRQVQALYMDIPKKMAHTFKAIAAPALTITLTIIGVPRGIATRIQENKVLVLRRQKNNVHADTMKKKTFYSWPSYQREDL